MHANIVKNYFRKVKMFKLNQSQSNDFLFEYKWFLSLAEGWWAWQIHFKNSSSPTKLLKIKQLFLLNPEYSCDQNCNLQNI